MMIRQTHCSPMPGTISVCMLALLTTVACTPHQPMTAADETEGSGHRFNFVRSKQLLMRIDTAQGGVWIVPENGDGGWVELGEPPDLAGEPPVHGRFALFSLAKQFGTQGHQLLRVDRATGRAWLRNAEGDGVWIQIESTEAPPPSTEPEPEPAAAASAPESSAVPLPVASREVIENSSGEESEKLAIVVQALQKEGLAVEIQIWAARQLTVFRPEIAVPPLLVALEHQRPEVVVAAISSLKQLGDPTTIPKIVALESHPSPLVREAARNAVTGSP